MAECVKHKAGISERETMYIDALDAFFKADGNKRKERNEAYTRALEKILYKYPDDIEARAFLALQLWKNRDAGIPISSHLAIDALIDQVLRARPDAPGPSLPHSPVGPARRPRTRSASAALCGQGSAGHRPHVAHAGAHLFQDRGATTTPAGSRKPRPASITPT